MRQQIPPTAGLPLRWRDLLWGSADFARRLEQTLHIPAPVLTCSGTAALIVSLRTLQQTRPDRHVIVVPGWTCPLVALAAHFCPPLRVVPCDLQYGGLDLDSDCLRQLCDKNTLAVVVTHLAGRVADALSARDIAHACGAAVIEDAAQALGAESHGQSVGLCGDIGFFSLAPGKGLTTMEGGILFSRHPRLHAQLRASAQQMLPCRPGWELRRIAELWGFHLLYHPGRFDLIYGRPLRHKLACGDEAGAVGDDLGVQDIPLHSLSRYRQRAGASALTRLPAWLADNRQRALQRCAQLARLPGVTVMQDRENQRGVWPFLTLLMPAPAARERAMQRLWCSGLGVTRLFVHALADYPAVRPLLLGSQTPNAVDFAARSLTITNSHWLSQTDFATILYHLQQSLR